MTQRCFLAMWLCLPLAGQTAGPVHLDGLDGVTIEFARGPAGWGVSILRGRQAALAEPRPIQIELFVSEAAPVERLARGYATVTQGGGAVTTRGEAVHGDARFWVEDTWRIRDGSLCVSRKLGVKGSAPGGFLSAITLRAPASAGGQAPAPFAPGMIYGGPENLTRSAIGGADSYVGGRQPELRIREDRLPAPVFGIRFPGGWYAAILNPRPTAETIAGDTRDLEAVPLIDERLRFGALGLSPADGPALGYWFPGTEGERTYRGNMYPGGQLAKWRRRYHPIRDGLAQEYSAAFRFGVSPSLPAFYRDVWRWAWDTVRPTVRPHDIAEVRRSLVDMLADRVERAPGGRMGIPNFVDSVGPRVDRKAVMGFTGKNLESAEFLLAEAARETGPRAERLRALGTAIFDSFTKLRVAPPEGEGFHLDTGEPVLAIPRDKVVYLRSFGDDMKATLRAVRRERAHGREHPNWVAWCRQFADWLLTQQQAGGGFPRSWRPGSGEVADASPQSTYNAVPFLALMAAETGDRRYLDAAVRAGEFAWSLAEKLGRFVGGTIDNPDVIDKEAGTLSLEAYLALYEATREAKWLDRARMAGDFAESWIYLWDVPMPQGEDTAKLHWKPLVPTSGLQLISSGHSLVDEYMTFDVDEFAKLYSYTKDPHYAEVARLLLHNTKQMLAVPGRIYDLRGPGWQQEHWSLAPMRGYGLHRGWLPWVSTSHLNGIFGLEEFDARLFRELAGGTAASESDPVTREEMVAEMETKIARVRAFLAERKLGGVLLTLVRNFSWLTAGLADNHVVITSETGAASLLVTADGGKYVVASNSEMPRLLAEDLRGLGFEPREFKWFEDKTAPDRKLAFIREIARGRKIASDAPYADLPVIEAELAPLRYELTDSEIKKYRWLGRHATEAVVEVCHKLQPGVTEREMEAMASDALLRRGIRPTVLLMGADRRVFDFRHPVPSDKKLERYAFVNVCARRWGLVVSTGRFVHFGAAPDELRKRARASANLTARFLAHTKPGARAGDILELAKQWYAANGFPGEWEKHHQGGAIGYAEREWVAFPGSPQVVRNRQAFAWNPIVQGALSFDTFILKDGQWENVSYVPGWPSITVEAGGAVFRLPDILERAAR